MINISYSIFHFCTCRRSFVQYSLYSPTKKSHEIKSGHRSFMKDVSEVFHQWNNNTMKMKWYTICYHHIFCRAAKSTSSKSSGNLFCKKERSSFKRLSKKYGSIKYLFTIPHQVFKLQRCWVSKRWVQ